MKNRIGLILMLLAFKTSSFAQVKEKELSNAEIFSAKAGTLIQREVLDIGAVNKASIQVLHLTDLISNQKISAIRFQMVVMELNSPDIKSASLDSDEIDGLIKSIRLIQENIFTSTPSNYTEVTYRSRGGFQAGCYWSKNQWSTYLKLEMFNNKTYVNLKKDDFEILLDLLENAKKLM